MVRYYGRAKQRTGSVNTNQLGLKMSGSPSIVGRNAFSSVSIANRVLANQARCGAVLLHGVVIKTNTAPCKKAAPKSAAVAGGVGRIWSPRI